MTATQTQLIRMVDQHGQIVDLDIRQDGQPPGLVAPGRRTRFKIKIRARGVVAFAVDSMVLPESPRDWHVHDVRVGTRSQLLLLADSPEEDGIPGSAFSSEATTRAVSFETCQAAQELSLDVAYRGLLPGGAPLVCLLRCTTVRQAG